MLENISELRWVSLFRNIHLHVYFSDFLLLLLNEQTHFVVIWKHHLLFLSQDIGNQSGLPLRPVSHHPVDLLDAAERESDVHTADSLFGDELPDRLAALVKEYWVEIGSHYAFVKLAIRVEQDLWNLLEF